MSKREDTANYVASMRPGLRQAYALAYLRHRLDRNAPPPDQRHFRALSADRMKAIERAIDLLLE
jgi:hypothetical protein